MNGLGDGSAGVEMAAAGPGRRAPAMPGAGPGVLTLARGLIGYPALTRFVVGDWPVRRGGGFRLLHSLDAPDTCFAALSLIDTAGHEAAAVDRAGLVAAAVAAGFEAERLAILLLVTARPAARTRPGATPANVTGGGYRLTCNALAPIFADAVTGIARQVALDRGARLLRLPLDVPD